MNLCVSDLPVECRSCFLACVGKCGVITHGQSDDLLSRLFHVAMFPPPGWDKPKKTIQQELGLT